MFLNHYFQDFIVEFITRSKNLFLLPILEFHTLLMNFIVKFIIRFIYLFLLPVIEFYSLFDQKFVDHFLVGFINFNFIVLVGKVWFLQFQINYRQKLLIIILEDFITQATIEKFILLLNSYSHTIENQNFINYFVILILKEISQYLNLLGLMEKLVHFLI